MASRVRFDLDLPAAEEDDIRLGPGLPLPEWDYRSSSLRHDWCRLQPMEARHADAMPLPERLRPHARRLRSQFAALAPVRRWLKAQPEGVEPDIDAWVRRAADGPRRGCQHGRPLPQPGAERTRPVLPGARRFVLVHPGHPTNRR